jgi:hypothetical protein
MYNRKYKTAGSGFAGRKFHCFSWQNSRCETYAPACDAQRAGECEVGPPGQIKKCVRMKKVPSLFYMKDVRRCAEYRPVCEAFCITSPAPREFRPEAPREEALPAEEPGAGDIRAVAKWMAAQFNEVEKEVGPALAREILSRGGIAPYRGRYLKEEYLDIPLHLRNRRGLKMDEMASEMGMDEAQLFEAIAQAYPAGREKKVRGKKSWMDFREEAYDYILAQQSEGTWAGLRGLWR